MFILPLSGVSLVPFLDKKDNDEVENPAHYNAHPSGVEAITITSGFDFVIGNCIKYLWRAGLKNPDPLPDLKKARWYLDYRIKELEDARSRGSQSGGQGGIGTGDR